MKKNTMMRVASALLVAVLLTTCAISGTFAKYVTSDTSSDTARVAKWGVVITGASDMFAQNYNDTVVTETNSEDKLVAPGTEGDLSAFNVTGQPEVDVAVTYEATLTLTGWTVDGDDYCPIVITVNRTDYFVGKDGIDSVAALKTAVETAIVNSKANYEANTDLSNEVGTDLSVSWRWEFNDGQNALTVPGQTDIKDTKLGDIAVTGNAPQISLVVNCTITQVD